MNEKRSLFAELKEGMEALAAEREGRKTLYGVELKPRVKIKPTAATIDMSTSEGKEEALRVVRKVIAEHREVLERLAKR
jgi:hypothetical protein